MEDDKGKTETVETTEEVSKETKSPATPQKREHSKHKSGVRRGFTSNHTVETQQQADKVRKRHKEV